MTSGIRFASLSFVAALVLAALPARAYDSRCRQSDPDCEGAEAAHQRWVHVEHAEIWERTREAAGLPVAVDAPFEVRTWTDGTQASNFPSLRPAPLDAARAVVARTVDIAMFAQLPDLSHALWDWASGNDGCPPTDSAGFPECHQFASHMGWLNSTHFPPQSGQAFAHFHALALARARRCADASRALDAAGISDPRLLEACDREALVLEAVAHHFLQDAWSMGHTWQRWGSPRLEDFRAAVAADASLLQVKTVGDAVGRASGLIHGAKAITMLADAMCSPDDGIEYVHQGASFEGAGDLNLVLLEQDPRFAAQRERLYGCTTAALREVYLASAQSLGPAGPATVAPRPLSECFSARATNRAIGLGAAVQIPLALVGASAAVSPAVAAAVIATSTQWLSSLGLSILGRTDAYVPLTSQLLASVNFVVPLQGGAVFYPAITRRWNEDMRRIQGLILISAVMDPQGTGLAEGGMGPLLGMQPNGQYPGTPPYFDPVGSWVPTARAAPVQPVVANAGDILARTFAEAHAADWCEAMTASGTGEFSLERLQARCQEQGLPPADRTLACDVCTTFAARHLVSKAPGTRLGSTSTCGALAPASVAVETNLDAADRPALGRAWCTTPPPPPPHVALRNAHASLSWAVPGDPYDIQSALKDSTTEATFSDSFQGSGSSSTTRAQGSVSGSYSTSGALAGTAADGRPIISSFSATVAATATGKDGSRQTASAGSMGVGGQIGFEVVGAPVSYSVTTSLTGGPCTSDPDCNIGYMVDLHQLHSDPLYRIDESIGSSPSSSSGTLTPGIYSFSVSCYAYGDGVSGTGTSTCRLNGSLTLGP
jgi:hypothetical protein